VCDDKDNIEGVENMNQENGKDAENDKTEEEISESGETTSSTTESDVSDVEMDSNNEDPFAWDKQVWSRRFSFVPVQCTCKISKLHVSDCM